MRHTSHRNIETRTWLRSYRPNWVKITYNENQFLSDQSRPKIWNSRQVMMRSPRHVCASLAQGITQVWMGKPPRNVSVAPAKVRQEQTWLEKLSHEIHLNTDSEVLTSFFVFIQRGDGHIAGLLWISVSLLTSYVLFVTNFPAIGVDKFAEYVAATSNYTISVTVRTTRPTR